MLMRLFSWWNTSTLNTAFTTWMSGEKIGEDEQGNRYYRSKKGRRWVIYNGPIEATRISPDWHGWLHHTFDAPPSDRPLEHKAWEKPVQPTQTGLPGAYAPAGSLRRAEPAARSDYEAWQPE